MTTESEQIRELKERAKGHFNAIKDSGVAHSRASMIIGFHAYRMKAEKLFNVIGFATEDEAREAAGVGESTWYAMIRLAESFKEIPEKRFVAMKQANAKALADLPDAKRVSTEWTRMAETMSIKDFTAKIDEELNGKARPSDSRERPAIMKLDMPESRKAVIMEKTRIFAETHGLDPADTGQIIEVMCVETTEVPTLIGAVTTALQRVKNLKLVLHGELSAEEMLVRIEKEMDEMVLDFSAALAQASPEVEREEAPF